MPVPIIPERGDHGGREEIPPDAGRRKGGEGEPITGLSFILCIKCMVSSGFMLLHYLLYINYRILLE